MLLFEMGVAKAAFRMAASEEKEEARRVIYACFMQLILYGIHAGRV